MISDRNLPDDIQKRIDAKRSDPDFMARLRRIIGENRRVLDRLAEHDGAVRSTDEHK